MTNEEQIRVRDDLYSALGTLDAAIDRLRERAITHYDWDWVKDARITADKARKAYAKLKGY